MIIERIS